MISIDVGCGYRDDIHIPRENVNIHIDPFLGLSSSEFISKLSNPIIASAQELPIRFGIIDQVFSNAVLEHLSNPIKALKNIISILTPEGFCEITIPILTNHFKHYLGLIFLAFPFGILVVLNLLPRVARNYRQPGLAHRSDINPKNVTQFFGSYHLEVIKFRHKWFYSWWGKTIKKILRLKYEPIRDIQGIYRLRGYK